MNNIVSQDLKVDVLPSVLGCRDCGQKAILTARNCIGDFIVEHARMTGHTEFLACFSPDKELG